MDVKKKKETVYKKSPWTTITNLHPVLTKVENEIQITAKCDRCQEITWTVQLIICRFILGLKSREHLFCDV